MGGASSHDIRDGILGPDDSDYERKLLQLNAAGHFVLSQPSILMERRTPQQE